MNHTRNACGHIPACADSAEHAARGAPRAPDRCGHEPRCATVREHETRPAPLRDVLTHETRWGRSWPVALLRCGHEVSYDPAKHANGTPRQKRCRDCAEERPTVTERERIRAAQNAERAARCAAEEAARAERERKRLEAIKHAQTILDRAPGCDNPTAVDLARLAIELLKREGE